MIVGLMMAHPYILRDKELEVVPGARAPVVLRDAPRPKPPIRQLPPPPVLIPGVRKGS